MPGIDPPQSGVVGNVGVDGDGNIGDVGEGVMGPDTDAGEGVGNYCGNYALAAIASAS